MYKNIREFIEELKKNVRVIALIKYGKRQVDDMSLGDYFSLYVIMNDFNSNIESVHFYIKGIPIDVNVRGYSDLLLQKPVAKFDLELLTGEILFDKSGIISRMLNKSKENWVEETPPKRVIDNNEIDWIRFSYKQILDKLKHNLKNDNLESKFKIDITMKNLIDTYFELNNLELNNENVLETIRDNEPLMYNYLEDFYLSRTTIEKFDKLVKIAGVVFKNTNGVCKSDEIMFLARDYNEEISEIEKEEIMEILALYN